MTREVVIKSNKYGINLVLDDHIPFPELLTLIGEKFKENGSFFKDAQMAISFEGRQLTNQEQLDIADVIMANCAVRIVSIIDSNKELEELMRERVEACERPGSENMASYVGSQNSMMRGMDIPPAADFYKGNLRSGQTLECASSVTLIGDVNPGARIVSGGNIVVLGSLKGNACAGAYGDNNCFIFALDMNPIQLQIGELIAKSPDKEKDSRRIRKKNKTEGSQYSPQIAVVRDGFICIEPMVKRCLDRL